MLNAPAAAKRSEEALKCIQERENVCAECTCGRERDGRSLNVHLKLGDRTMVLEMEA